MAIAWMTKAFNVRTGNPTAKAVLIKLADYSNAAGECWPSHASIEFCLELSRASVKRQIKHLVSLGLISAYQRPGYKGNASNFYQLHESVFDQLAETPPKEWGFTQNPQITETPPGGQSEPTGGQSEPPGGSERTPRGVTVNPRTVKRTVTGTTSEPPREPGQKNTTETLSKIEVVLRGGRSERFTECFLKQIQKQKPDINIEIQAMRFAADMANRDPERRYGRLEDGFIQWLGKQIATRTQTNEISQQYYPSNEPAV